MNACSKERIREFSPIRELVGEIIPLKGNTGRCPKHDDRHPSFTVNPEKGICRCWAGCTDGSLDVFGFYQWYYDCTFPEAIEKLAKRVGIVIDTPERKNSKKGPWEEMKELAAECRMSCRRWERYVLSEIGFVQAERSQKKRKRAYQQYERAVVTKYGLETRLLALEKQDREFDEQYELYKKEVFKNLR